jgi:ABC-type molybdenum transport system ATPase subunit/photorepair protein PhrA
LGVEDDAMVAARTIGTLIVTILFFGYVFAANVYLQMMYFNKGKAAGPAVPITQHIQQITRTITQYMQIATMIVIAAIAVNIAIKSRRILGIIPFKDVQRHLLLLGPTGSGKTTIAKKVIDMAVKRGIKVTILDWKAGSRAFHCGLPRPVKQPVGHLYVSHRRVLKARLDPPREASMLTMLGALRSSVKSTSGMSAEETRLKRPW